MLVVIPEGCKFYNFVAFMHNIKGPTFTLTYCSFKAFFGDILR